MKFRTYGMVLSLFFALGLVFSFSVEASASHVPGGTDTIAEDVDATSKEEVEAFLGHIISYWDKVIADNIHDINALTREVVIYGRAIRQEGAYKHSKDKMPYMYSFAINERNIVTNHAGYPNLFGHEFDSGATGSAVASTIEALIESSGVKKTACVEDYDGQGRVACATKVLSAAGNVTVIAGLHHELDDDAFDEPDCTFKLTTTAQQVYEDPTDNTKLEAYVKGVIEVSQDLIADITARVLEDFLADGGMPQDLGSQAVRERLFGDFGEANKRLFDKAACFRSTDFRHKNIYAFIMDADPAVSTVLFNGNNFDLNGANLELNDDTLPGSDKSIAGLFNRALEGKTSAYVNYRWEDPDIMGDEVANFFRDRKVPGTSCKTSYIEVADLDERRADAAARVLNTSAETVAPLFSERLYIFGSGTYPGEGPCASGGGDGDNGGNGDSGGDGGACAIAGTGNTSQSALLNLFLVASVLFSIAFLRRRV